MLNSLLSENEPISGKSATAKEYSLATGLEALFGGLYLSGKQERLNQLFRLMVE